MSNTFTKQIRKPMPSPSVAFKGVKDAPRSKGVDLSEWCFDDLTPKADQAHLDLVEDGVWDFDDLPSLYITEGRSWKA